MSHPKAEPSKAFAKVPVPQDLLEKPINLSDNARTVLEKRYLRRGENGKPERLWDRDTGEIDTDVAKTWERYDIRLILERNWIPLAPKLNGKLHGFHRRKNDALLMFCLRHYGEDANGKRTTINYFSTRATAVPSASTT